MGKLYQIKVTGFHGETIIAIDLCNTEEQMKTITVLQLKEKIAERLPGNIDTGNLRMIFTDKQLKGDSTLLSSYGIQNQSVIQIVIRVPGGQTRWTRETCCC